MQNNVLINFILVPLPDTSFIGFYFVHLAEGRKMIGITMGTRGWTLLVLYLEAFSEWFVIYELWMLLGNFVELVFILKWFLFAWMQLFRKLTRDVRAYVQKVSSSNSFFISLSILFLLLNQASITKLFLCMNSVWIMEKMLTYNLQLKQKQLLVVSSTLLLLGTGGKQMQLVLEQEYHRLSPNFSCNFLPSFCYVSRVSIYGIRMGVFFFFLFLSFFCS